MCGWETNLQVFLAAFLSNAHIVLMREEICLFFESFNAFLLNSRLLL